MANKGPITQAQLINEIAAGVAPATKMNSPEVALHPGLQQLAKPDSQMNSPEVALHPGLQQLAKPDSQKHLPAHNQLLAYLITYAAQA